MSCWRLLEINHKKLSRDYEVSIENESNMLDQVAKVYFSGPWEKISLNGK